MVFETIPVYLGATEPYVGDYTSTESYELHSISCKKNASPVSLPSFGLLLRAHAAHTHG